MSRALVKLVNVADINPRFQNGTSSSDEMVAFAPMAAVSAETGTVDYLETRPLSSVLTGFTWFQNGDILLAKITPCFENGKIAMARISQHHGFGSTEFHVVRAHSTELDARYLLHFLRQPRIRVEGERKMTGSAGQRRVPRHFLENLEIPLPPLLEQHRIAMILDHAEVLRAKRRQALAKIDTLAQSLFIDLFGSPKQNPKGWPIVPLIEICSPKQWPTISTSELLSDGYPVFGANGQIGYYSEYNHEHPTVLVTCRGATCGTINVCPPKCYVTGNAMALDSPDGKRITNAYLEWVLRLRGMMDTISGTAQPQITRQGLEPVKLQLPPLPLQEAFSRQLACVNHSRTTQSLSESKLNALFASLQHRVFRGEL